MNLRKLLGIKSKEEEGELKRKETLSEGEAEMIGLRTRAIAAFKEYGKSMEGMATAEFEQDFGVGPDEVAYLGNHKFLFTIEDLHIRGYIEYMGAHLYAKGYRLAALCPHCDGLIVAKEHFSDLASLGAALDGLPKMRIMCDSCDADHSQTST